MYTPLYIKTHNSLLQSLIRIDELIDFAKQNNIKSLTITDNNMYGVIEFYDKCIKNDIKPIVGLEIDYIVLYAMNYKGYQNLMKLTTIMSQRIVETEDIIKYSSDLVCITTYQARDRYGELAKHFKHIFQGYHNLDERNDLKGSLVYMNEILYFNEKDKQYLPYLYAIKDGVTVSSVTINKNDNHFLNYKDYSNENNELITDLCDLELVYNQKLLPTFECPNNMDSYTYLKQLIKEGLKRHFGENVPLKYIQRLQYELDIINKMGFCDYFLIVWDYVKFAKQNGILVGPGRGSAAGCLVSYCLDITTIDPIKYHLLFERFLNPERISMPDIDIDFEFDRREEVINYCINKYGLKKVAPIITFGTLGSKQVIRDVARAMEIDLKIVDKICKLLDSKKNLATNYQDNIKLHQLLTDELKKMYQIAMKLEGLKRHTSIHAAGIVISCKDLDEVIPLQKSHDNFYTTGYSMEYLESLGLLKMDILALKNLTLLNDILKEVNLDFDEIPLEDKKALDVFTKVDTIGIFQFESAGMINFLEKFRPNCFEDIVAAIALFRPGPMKNIDSYIKRKHGQEKIDYYDDSLISVLKPTYGIIVYQEQIMEIAHILANYSLAEADVLRKAMSKKQEAVLLKEKDKFLKQSILNGFSETTATRVYDLILKFASYGFNRAHSVAYSMISYKMAYLKAHYPLIFIKHLLTSVVGSEIKTKEYIYAAKAKGLIIHKPDINISKSTYIIHNNQLYYPLTNIKGIGENVAKQIVLNQPYKDIFDFVIKNKTKNFTSLIMADCFACFNYNQKTVDKNIDILLNYSELGSLLNEEELKPIIVQDHEYEQPELLKREIDVFGFYLTNHPLTKYRDQYPVTINNLNAYFNKRIDIVICIEKIRSTITKKNETMLFITGSDETGTIDMVLFPSQYKEGLQIGNMYLVKGKVEKRFDKYQVIVNEINDLE